MTAAVLKAVDLRCDTRAQMHQHPPHSRRGLDRVSTSDSQSSPHGRPSQHAPANRTQPRTAEYQGSSIIADQPRSRAHTDSSVLLGPNPISVFDFRISPWKQAVRQRTQTAPIRKRRNPAVPRPRSAGRQTGHGSEAEPNPISRSNLRTSPRKRPARHVVAICNHAGAAKYQSSRNTARRTDR